MPQNAAYYRGLWCLLRQKLFDRTKQASVKEMKYYLETRQIRRNYIPDEGLFEKNM